MNAAGAGMYSAANCWKHPTIWLETLHSQQKYHNVSQINYFQETIQQISPSDNLYVEPHYQIVGSASSLSLQEMARGK